MKTRLPLDSAGANTIPVKLARSSGPISFKEPQSAGERAFNLSAGAHLRSCRQRANAWPHSGGSIVRGLVNLALRDTLPL